MTTHIRIWHELMNGDVYGVEHAIANYQIALFRAGYSGALVLNVASRGNTQIPTLRTSQMFEVNASPKKAPTRICIIILHRLINI